MKTKQIVENIVDKVAQQRPSINIYDFAVLPREKRREGFTKEKISEVFQRPVSHRMEFVAEHRGVTFINDSQSCNVNGLWYALETVDRRTVLIMGGRDQGNDYAVVDELVKNKVRAIICIGEDNKRIRSHFKDITPVYEAGNMIDAMDLCLSIAARGECVLLSPACSSFDRYRDYEDRGNQFKEAVKFYS